MTNNKVEQDNKLRWMLEHRHLWEHLEPDGLYVHNRQAWRAIADALRADGLYSRTTSTIDIRVSELIKKARRASAVSGDANAA